MSALETSEQDRPGSLLRYAPRPTPLPDEDGTIRPILQRLSRGETDTATEIRVLPAVEPLDIGDSPRRRRWPYHLVACTAASAGLSAGLAILLTGWLGPASGERTHTDAIDLSPKVVRTVSFKPEVPADNEHSSVKPASESPPDQQALNVSDTDHAAPAPPTANPELPSKAKPDPQQLLTLWAAIPASVPAPAAIAPQQETTAEQVVDAEPSAAQPEQSAPRTSAHHHARRHAHWRRARRHLARSNASLPAARAEATPNAAADAGNQPAAANPLQSAFQSMFGQAGSATAQNSRDQASPTRSPALGMTSY